jgi:hypothetical protein
MQEGLATRDGADITIPQVHSITGIVVAPTQLGYIQTLSYTAT